MQAALKANDYNAFVTAWNAQEHKKPNATVPTQEQFNEMVARHKQHEAVMNAIEANDYEAYVEAIKPTKEEFAKIVEKHAEMKAKQASSTMKTTQ
jgi:DNA-binding GntR family transcriptional regulator